MARDSHGTTSIFRTLSGAFLALLLCGAPVPAGAQQNCPALTVYTGDLPPFNFTTDDGSFDGLAVELLVRMSQMAGCRIDPASFQAPFWPRALRETLRTPNSMIFSLARTHERENDFRWVGPIGCLRLGLVARKDRHIVISDIGELAHYNIGTIRDSAPAAILRTLLPPGADNLTELGTNQQQFGMLKLGRVDLITQSESAFRDILKHRGMNPADYEIIYVLNRLELYYAFNRDTDPAYLARLQLALGELKKPGPDGGSEYERIRARHTPSCPEAGTTPRQ